MYTQRRLCACPWERRKHPLSVLLSIRCMCVYTCVFVRGFLPLFLPFSILPTLFLPLSPSHSFSLSPVNASLQAVYFSAIKDWYLILATPARHALSPPHSFPSNYEASPSYIFFEARLFDSWFYQMHFYFIHEESEELCKKQGTRDAGLCLFATMGDFVSC